MSRSLGSAKATEWRERLRRFSGAGLTVAGFCEEEGVSVASFYHWRKRLGTPRPRRRKRSQAPAFQPVVVKPSSAPVTIEFSSGARLEMPPDNVDLVRAVVSELARAGQGQPTGEAPC